MTIDRALEVLGLCLPVNTSDISEARRRLAKGAHPDVGGAVGDMSRINEAADALLSALGVSDGSSADFTDTPDSANNHTAHADRPQSDTAYSDTAYSDTAHWDSAGRRRPPTEVDHPSFVIDALPVEAFEALLIVASWLGDVIDDDPPYRLDVALSEPRGTWCQLNLVPDAGASTISIAVGRFAGHRDDESVSAPDIVAIRDEWVAALNQLDWDGLTQP